MFHVKHSAQYLSLRYNPHLYSPRFSNLQLHIAAFTFRSPENIPKNIRRTERRLSIKPRQGVYIICRAAYTDNIAAHTGKPSKTTEPRKRSNIR